MDTLTKVVIGIATVDIILAGMVVRKYKSIGGASNALRSIFTNLKNSVTGYRLYKKSEVDYMSFRLESLDQDIEQLQEDCEYYKGRCDVFFDEKVKLQPKFLELGRYRAALEKIANLHRPVGQNAGIKIARKVINGDGDGQV